MVSDGGGKIRASAFVPVSATAVDLEQLRAEVERLRAIVDNQEQDLTDAAADSRAEIARLTQENARLMTERDQAVNVVEAARLSSTSRPGEPCPGCGRTDFSHGERCRVLAIGILRHQLSLLRSDRAAERDVIEKAKAWRGGFVSPLGSTADLDYALVAAVDALTQPEEPDGQICDARSAADHRLVCASVAGHPGDHQNEVGDRWSSETDSGS
jgi:hypothetical protein